MPLSPICEAMEDKFTCFQQSSLHSAHSLVMGLIRDNEASQNQHIQQSTYTYQLRHPNFDYLPAEHLKSHQCYRDRWYYPYTPASTDSKGTSGHPRYHTVWHSTEKRSTAFWRNSRGTGRTPQGISSLSLATQREQACNYTFWHLMLRA